MLLPSVTAYSAPHAMDRYADCARAMGLADETKDTEKAVQSLIQELECLNADLKVPSTSEFGIGNNKYFSLVETMATQALESGSPGNNPRVPSAEDIISIYEDLWK